MHDIADLEGRGVVSAGLVTTEFADAVETQCAALGFDPAVVLLPHPIQNLTDEELVAVADAYFEAIKSKLCAAHDA